MACSVVKVLITLFCCSVQLDALVPTLSNWHNSHPTGLKTNIPAEMLIEQVGIRVNSMNILAPCYNRLPCGGLESDDEKHYIKRNEQICQLLIERDADVICLQEFWSGTDMVRKIYIDKLRERGYSCSELRRTNHWRRRSDGLACFVKDERVTLQDTRNIFFHDCGDRVAQLLLLAVTSEKSSKNVPIPPQQFLLVNTHLLFPHNEFSHKIRMREMTKILGFVESYRQVEMCSAVCGRADVRVPVILAGDLNGSQKGKTYQFVRSQNFQSAMEASWGPESPRFKSWVSHKSHLNKTVGVDHVLFLNPKDQIMERLPPIPDWTNMVFREVMERIRERGGFADDKDATDSTNTEVGAMRDVFNVLDKDKSMFLTRDEFELGLLELGFGKEGEPALTKDEIDVLLQSADVNGDGTIDFKEFCDRFLVAASGDETNRLKTRDIPFSQGQWLVQSFDGDEKRGDPAVVNGGRPLPSLLGAALVSKVLANARPLGNLSVKKVSIFPEALESGHWPADYLLSDHGLVEAEFVGSCMM